MLSAGHCLDGRGDDSFEVRIGSKDKDKGGELIQARKIAFHPEFDERLPFGVDVALIFLERSTKLDIPLLRLNDDNSYPEGGTTAVVVGWGDTKSGGDQSDILLEVAVDVITNDECEKDYDGKVLDTMICTPEGEGHCQGKHI